MTMVKPARFGIWRTLAALAILATLVIAGSATATAQDASPMASPAAAECVSPGLPPGTPTPHEEEEMASPVASPAPAEMASPEAIEIPEASPLPEGQPADEATAAAIIAAIENYAACYNEGQASGDPSLYVALETANFWAFAGFTNPYDRVADEMESPFKTATLVSVGNPMTYDDGRVSADIEVVLGDHFFVHQREFLVQDGDVWKLDGEATLKPEPEAESVSVNGVQIVETTDEATGEVTYEFVSTVASFDWQPAEALIINVSNLGVELHEALVLQLPEGADPLGLLDGSVPFEDVTFYGGVFGIQPGETQDIALLNLPPGTYTLICFIPGPDGTPHAANGMVVNFNIVAPAG
jgi:hypothetical protein